MRLFPLRLIPLTAWLWMLISKVMTHFRSPWFERHFVRIFFLFSTIYIRKLCVFQIKAVNQKSTLLLMMMKWSFGQSNSQCSCRYVATITNTIATTLNGNSDTICLAQPIYCSTFYFHNFLVLLLISLTIPFPRAPFRRNSGLWLNPIAIDSDEHKHINLLSNIFIMHIRKSVST